MYRFPDPRLWDICIQKVLTPSECWEMLSNFLKLLMRLTPEMSRWGSVKSRNWGEEAPSEHPKALKFRVHYICKKKKKIKTNHNKAKKNPPKQPSYLKVRKSA